MDFRLMNMEEFPNRFLVVVDQEDAAERFRSILQQFDEQATVRSIGNWQYEVFVGSDVAMQYQGEKPRYIIVYRDVPNVDIPKLVEKFQVPILFVTPMNGIINTDKRPSYQQLLSPVVYGFLENPTNEELFMAILQMYWMTVAVKAIQDAGMMMGGIRAGQ